uniref:Solute carrier family 40 protein n=1 Tax=Rhabditophanes sp. KR3021 TaxID=114890 RepID=A0AC35UIH2_9BILA
LNICNNMPWLRNLLSKLPLQVGDKLVGKTMGIMNDLPSLEGTIKCLSECQIIIGLICLILSTLADLSTTAVPSLRLFFLQEICSIYILISGVIGLCGITSKRKMLVICYLIFVIHSLVVFTPVIIITASFDIRIFYQNECYGECNFHLLSMLNQKHTKCQILCGDDVDNQQRSSMTRLGSDIKLLLSLITFASVNCIISTISVIVCLQHLFNFCLLTKEKINVFEMVRLSP